MDRRDFLATSGLLAAAPVLAHSPAAGTAVPTPGESRSDQVQFTSDGLGLSAQEYAAVLSQAVAEPGFRSDYYSLDGSIAALETRFAKLLGKPAAMFVPTGTLANHLAIRKLAGHDRRVLLQAESHFYNDSGDCAQTLSGLNLVPLAPGRTGFTLEEVQEWVSRSAGGRVETRVGVIAIESPVRRTQHAMFDFEQMRRISSWAREHGIRLHLDGARLFNLPLHSGHSIVEHTALFDTVFVSLWKHFNAGAGAILAGEADFIEGLYHERRMFGGALPAAWPEAAVSARYIDSFEADYAASWRTADALVGLLVADGRFKARKLTDGTSRFFLKLSAPVAEAFVERIRARGVGIAPANPDTGEFALQVNPSILRKSPEALARIFIEALQS